MHSPFALCARFVFLHFRHAFGLPPVPHSVFSVLFVLPDHTCTPSGTFAKYARIEARCSSLTMIRRPCIPRGVFSLILSDRSKSTPIRAAALHIRDRAYPDSATNRPSESVPRREGPSLFRAARFAIEQGVLLNMRASSSMPCSPQTRASFRSSCRVHAGPRVSVRGMLVRLGALCVDHALSGTDIRGVWRDLVR